MLRLWYNLNMASKETKKLGWHFLPASKKLTYGDGRKVRVGSTVTMKGNLKPVCCNHGMHASEKVSQAANFGRGPVLTRVEVWGGINSQGDKFCGRHRRVLWMKEITMRAARSIMKSMDSNSSLVYTDVVGLLKELATSDSVAFNLAVERWAKRNGLGTPTPAAAPTRPPLQEKDLLKLLAPRIVRTKKEILRDMGGFYDLASPVDYVDAFDQLVSSCSRIRIVVNIDGRGSLGYVLLSKSR